MKPIRNSITAVSVMASAGVLLMAALPASARHKPDPVPQWAVEAAKTPTPASAKDAPAVLLFDEYVITVDAQNHAVERERSAMRVLQPQGRDYTHCSIGYDVDEKLNYFRAWTITSDGHQLQAMDSDFRDEGAYSDPTLQYTERIRTLDPPGNDPGSVVVCETEEQLRPYMSQEEWQIQLSIPVVDEALELDLPPGVHYATSWSRYTPVKPTEASATQARWEIKNMPALDLENLHATPPWMALAAHMSVMWGEGAVDGTANQWRAIGQWMQNLEEHRPDPTPEITAEAQQLVAGAPDFYTRLSRITDYIQRNIRYFVITKGIGGWRAHYAGDIYRNRYGDCKDKTTLLISMLQAIGVRAYYLHVDTRRGIINPDAPSLMGNHVITAIELPPGEADPRLHSLVKLPNGKTLLIFDPTDEETPAGLIRAQLQGAWGNMADGSDSRVLQMPVLAPDSAGMHLNGAFTLAADGTLTGDIHESLTGDDATTERWFLKYNDTQEVRQRLEQGIGSELPGLQFKDYAFKNIADLDQPLGLDLHFTVANYAHPSGPLLLLRPHVMGSDTRYVPEVMDGKPRLYPIELGHPGRWRDSFDITIPPGYTVDEIPDPASIDTDFASYHSSATVRGNIIHYESEYVLRNVEIPPSKAVDFQKLENTILADE